LPIVPAPITETCRFMNLFDWLMMELKLVQFAAASKE